MRSTANRRVAMVAAMAVLASVAATAAPIPVDAGLVVWLRSDNVAVSGSTVTGWSDLTNPGSGIGDATAQDAATINGAPSIVTGAVNGLPSVNFGGGGAYGYTGAIGLVDFTAFAVGQNNAATATERVVQIGNVVSGANGTTVGLDVIDSGGGSNGAGTRYNNGNNTFTPGWETNNATYHVSVFSMADGGRYDSSTYSIDGTAGTFLQSSSAASTATFTGANDQGYTFGRGVSNAGGAVDWLTGRVAEVLIYSSQLSAADENRVGYYLQQRYALATAYAAPTDIFFDDLDPTDNDWQRPANWDTATEPVATQNAYIGNGLTATVSQAGEVAGTLTIGHNQATLPGVGTLTLTGGDLTVTGNIALGSQGFTGTLTVNGGTLNANSDLQLGGTPDSGSNVRGNVTQTAGIVTVGGDLLFGGAAATEGGTYNLNGGSLTVTGDIIEGAAGAPNANVDSAQLQVSGGTLAVTGDITVQRFSLGQVGGSTGTYTIPSGQTLTTTGTLSVAAGANSTGTLDLGTGTTLTNSNVYIGEAGGSNGTVNMTGGAWSVDQFLRIGNSGTGKVTIESGTLDILGISGDPRGLRLAEGAAGNGTLIIGTAAGSGVGGVTINVSGGNTETADEGIGAITMHHGTFNQFTSNIIVGQAAGSDATFTLNDGLIDIENQLRVANAGKGLFVQNGGTVNVGTILDLANTTGGDGTYRMLGGTLNAGDRVASNLIIGNINDAGASARMEIIDGTVNASRGIRIADNGSDSSGTLVIGNGTTTPIINLNTAGGGNFETADNGTGTVEFYSGTINQNTDNLIISQTSTSNATFTMSGGIYDTTQATVNNAAHGDLNINDGLGVLNVSGGRMSVQDINLGRNSGDGTLNLSGGILEVRGGLDFRSGGLTDVVNVQGGRLDLINGGTLHFRNGDDAVHLTAGVLDMGGGTIDFHGTSATFDFSGGTLLDVGTFGASLVQNGATSMLAPGASPGTTVIAGAYDLLAGIYQVEINGTAQGVDPGYDFVDVTGAAYLDGTVRVEFIAGYVSPMMSFDVLTATQISLGPNFLVDTGLAQVSGRYWTWDIIDGGNGQILQLNHVPEPVTLGLLGAGTLGLLIRRRRFRKGKHGRETAMKATTLGVWTMVLALLMGLVPCASAGLVAQWQLDDGTGSATAVDSVGGNTGTLTNMTPVSDWIAAPPPTVPSGTTFNLDFDGSNDHVLITGYKGITGAADRSMGAWIKTTDQSATILSWGKNNGGEKWNFRTQNTNGPAGTIRVEVSGGYQVGTTVVTDDAWHHVATTFAGDNVNDVRLWVDGELEGIGAVGGQSINTGGATPGTGNDVRIGTSVPGDTKHFQGRMDEVRLYNHELDRNDIRALAGLAPDPYFAAVTADAPVAYYRLGEPSGSKAFNEGTPVSTPTAPSAIDGAYGGNVEYGQPSLVPSVTNTAARFDGTNDDRVVLPDHDDINTDGAGYSEKSFEAWFNTDAYAGGGAERVIYEQGGGTHGFNLYLQRDAGNYYLRYGAWTNNGAPAHFPTRVQVTPGEDYHAVAVYNDADDSYTLYLNGVPVSAKVNANVATIAAHGDDGAIGAKRENTRFDNGGSTGNGNRFDGTIDDVALYNSPLSIYSIQTHYEAATGDRLGIRERAALGVALNYDADEDTDGNTTWEDSIGSRTNGAAANQFDFNVTGVPRVAVTANFEIDNAYQFTGTGVGTTGMESVAGNPTNNSATFEVLFRPSDLLGQEVIFESGGTTDGISLWLDGSLLRFDVKNGSNNARTTLDLAGIPLGFFHIIGVADLDDNEARLYNFGFLAATSTTVGTVVDWAGSDNFGLGGVSGAINFGSPGGFTGDISLFRFYPWELTDAQIRANAELLTPEPGTLTLLTLGGLGLLRRRRRKNRGGSKSAAAMVLLAAMLMLAPTSQAGLVAHWDFDDTPPSTTAAEAVAGNTGTLVGLDGTAAWVSTGLPPVPDGTTGALSFDGSNHHVAVAGYKGVTGTTPRTVSAWVKTTKNDAAIISWGTDAGGEKWVFRTQTANGQNGAIRIEVNGGFIVGNTDIRDNQWHHVAAVLPTGVTDVQNMVLYVDGLNDGWSARQSKAINTASGADVRIGQDQSSREFVGVMDDVRIYDHGMTHPEIRSLVSPWVYEQAVVADDPIAYWKLDETSGTTALNFGSIGPAVNATYDTAPAGGTPATLGAPSLVLTMPQAPAVSLDGTDDYIDVPDHGQINTGGPYAQKTVELWFQASDTSARQFLYEQGGGTNGLGIYIEGGDLIAGIWSNNGTNSFFNTPILADEAYHVAFVFDATNDIIAAYLNGVLFGITSGGTINDLPAHIGDAAIGGIVATGNSGAKIMDGTIVAGPNYFFGGTLDEIALYNVALTDMQIRTHYAAAIPEPGTMALLALGGLGALARRRRKSRRGSKSVAPVALLAAMLLLAPASQAGLVAHWKLDEGTGTQTADATGNGHTGTLKPVDTGGTGPLWITAGLAPVPSGTSAALDFDGTEDHVGFAVDSYKGVVGTNDRSISAWVKTNSSGDQGLVSWGNNAAGQKWTFRVQDDNGTVGAIRIEVNGGYVVGSQTVADGQWHHVVAAWANGGTPNVLDTKLYVDGILQVHSGALDEPINTVANRNVNLAHDESDRYLNGQLDEVRIYDHELSATEVHALAGGAPAPYREAVHASDPIAYWRLDEAAGTTAYNYGSIGNTVNGTYTSGTTLGEPSLVLTMANTSAVAFDGAAGSITVPDHSLINTGTRDKRTVELWFNANTVTATKQVLYEQGGSTRGISIYTVEEGGEDRLYMGIWNLANDGGESQWSHWGYTPITEGETYFATLVFDSNADNAQTGQVISPISTAAPSISGREPIACGATATIQASAP